MKLLPYLNWINLSSFNISDLERVYHRIGILHWESRAVSELPPSMRAVSVWCRHSVSLVEAVRASYAVLAVTAFPLYLQLWQLLPGESVAYAVGHWDAAGGNVCPELLQYFVSHACWALFLLTQTSVMNVLLEKLPEFMLDRSVIVDVSLK